MHPQGRQALTKKSAPSVSSPEPDVCRTGWTRGRAERDDARSRQSSLRQPTRRLYSGANPHPVGACLDQLPHVKRTSREPLRPPITIGVGVQKGRAIEVHDAAGDPNERSEKRAELDSDEARGGRKLTAVVTRNGANLEQLAVCLAHVDRLIDLSVAPRIEFMAGEAAQSIDHDPHRTAEVIRATGVHTNVGSRSRQQWFWFEHLDTGRAVNDTCRLHERFTALHVSRSDPHGRWTRGHRARVKRSSSLVHMVDGQLDSLSMKHRPHAAQQNR